MTTLYRPPASIECQRADVKARTIGVPYPAKKKGKNLNYLSKCDGSAEAIIVKELHPKKPLIKKESQLNLGDSIEGDQILVWTSHRYKEKKKKIIADSSTHRAQKVTMGKDFVYARLDRKYGTVPD